MRKPTLNGNLLVLLWSLASIAPTAQADVYLHNSAEQGILISNLPDHDIIYQWSFPEARTEQNPPPPATSSAAAPDALPYNEAVQAAARATRLEPALLHAVIAVESHHNPKAVSPRGAQGLMQLMPGTAQRYQLHNPYDPVQNVRAGASYLRELHDLFQGDLTLVLAAYNAGPGAVIRYGKRIPPFTETQHYVPRVLKLYRDLGKRM